MPLDHESTALPFRCITGGTDHSVATVGVSAVQSTPLAPCAGLSRLSSLGRTCLIFPSVTAVDDCGSGGSTFLFEPGHRIRQSIATGVST